MPNQIMVIAPYWLDDVGAWVFDDPKKDWSRSRSLAASPR